LRAFSSDERQGLTFKGDRTRETAVVTLAGELDMAATFRTEPELERLTRDTDAGRSWSTWTASRGRE